MARSGEQGLVGHAVLRAADRRDEDLEHAEVVVLDVVDAPRDRGIARTEECQHERLSGPAAALRLPALEPRRDGADEGEVERSSVLAVEPERLADSRRERIDREE